MDYAALFAAIPTPYLVLTPDLVIAEANQAYLAVVGRSREDIVGRPVFEAFPPRPDALDDSGVSRVQVSFERARDTGRPDTMPIQKYDILDTATGEFVERFWSLISVPVLDEQGRTTLVLQRAEDVTDYIRVRAAESSAAAAARRMSETLQRSLLTEPPQPPQLQIAVRYRPAVRDAQIGGDWYDAFVAPDGSTSLVVGDVAGHDRDAAAAMGQIRNLLRGIAYTIGKPPAAVLSALDRALRDLAVGSLATAVLARIEGDGPRRVLRWSNAGHPPPLLVQPDGAVHVLRTPADLLLGLDAGTPRQDHACGFAPGATVLLYTDGLVERRDTDLDEGVTRLAEVVGELAGQELEALCDTLLDRLGSPGEDDIALLALRLHPTPAGPEPV